MGLRFRKSIRLGKGIRLNFNSKSTSVTFGTKGFHHTINSTGKTRTTVGIPGTGLSYSVANNTSNHSLKTTCSSEKSKNKTVALILCVLGGMLGLHRFYVGKIGTGILWFCTLGLFCIGWFSDIVSIAKGNFKDCKGNIIQ